MTSLQQYINQPYRLEIVWSEPEDGPGGWVANVCELNGCQAQGDTLEELTTNIRRAMEAWIDAELTDGHEIPPPGDMSEWTAPFVAIAPVVIVQNAPDLATRYRELLLALSGATRPAVVAG